MTGKVICMQSSQVWNWTGVHTSCPYLSLSEPPGSTGITKRMHISFLGPRAVYVLAFPCAVSDIFTWPSVTTASCVKVTLTQNRGWAHSIFSYQGGLACWLIFCFHHPSSPPQALATQDVHAILVSLKKITGLRTGAQNWPFGVFSFCPQIRDRS